MSGFVGRLEAEKPKVLTIDDEKDFLELNYTAIKRLGYEPITVHAVKNADAPKEGFDYVLDDPNAISKILQEQKPTVVITDYDMGKFTAPDIIKAIRNTAGFENIPIMVRTTHDRHDLVKFLRDAKIDPESVSYSDKKNSGEIFRVSIKSLILDAKGAGAPPLT